MVQHILKLKVKVLSLNYNYFNGVRRLIVRKVSDVEPQPVVNAEGVTVRWIFSRPENVPNFAMRYFHMKKGSMIKEHFHDWEHEIYVVKGRLIITAGEEKAEVSEGCAIYIPPNILHSFLAIEESEFLCMIPLKGAP